MRGCSWLNEHVDPALNVTFRLVYLDFDATYEAVEHVDARCDPMSRPSYPSQPSTIPEPGRLTRSPKGSHGPSI
jgi:hypothetical protein